MKATGLLFVCAGNICRSPLAEGIFAHLVRQRGLGQLFLLDSAGTGGWHAGDAPDPRSIVVARSHGIDISGQQARRIGAEDFGRFDLILAMDRANLADLRRASPAGARAGLHLFCQYALAQERDIPDPYYGGPGGFETVYTMLLAGCSSLMARLEPDLSS